MRLLTHNLMRCNIKGVENGYPLRIEPSITEIVEQPFDQGN